MARTPDLPDLKELEEQQRALEEQIQTIRSIPDELLRQAQEQASTLPPPDDLTERHRRKSFEEKAASRGQVRNERRTQGKSLLLLCFLLAATGALTAWVVKLFVA